MKSIAVVGAGKIGLMIADMLSSTGDYAVTIIDQYEESLARVKLQVSAVETRHADASDQSQMEEILKDKFAVINCCPFNIGKTIARAAVAQGAHYFDLTEDVASTRIIKDLAKDAKTALVPQCGLAPGFISIVAYDLAKKFDTLHNVHMRVGALPRYPSNALKYNLTWSTDGLINEYLNPCEAIVNGKLREVPPLEELETFSLDGDDYEAFNTSGGLGTLCETLEGKVKNLNYRTVRYPGHRDLMKMLINDLGLGDRPELLKDIMEASVPVTMQDVVLVFVNVSGTKNGMFVQETFARKVYSREINNTLRSAIQITTSSGICAALDLMVEGKLPQQGFVRQEDICFDDFVANRFGRNFMDNQNTVGSHNPVESEPAVKKIA
ncbi:saccharopine dehydrogenase family protein [Hahella ganghwensis]|uniref:saccharopine dehydrogenase family protein n=1 Tax=Hahella ganghwensis TaxID=286420 RepID=UPI000369B7CF|nr:saccharopine dehydrogenase family protein [Hahella ganghwensis]